MEQSEGEAGKNSDKQGTKTLAFRTLRLQRPKFRDGEKYKQKIPELLGAVENKRKLIETFRSDILHLWPRKSKEMRWLSTRRTFWSP